MKDIKVLGIDLAKHVFEVCGMTLKGEVLIRKQFNRKELTLYMANLPQCLVAMEACGSSNYWAREFRKMGHDARLISPQYVKAFVKTNKNDQNDAEAIAEAALRPQMRFVPIKESHHQDLQAILRVRHRLVRNRTALGNEIRGLLGEYGIVLPQTWKSFKTGLSEMLWKGHTNLSQQMERLFGELMAELREIEKRIAQQEQKLHRIHESNEVCQRLSKVGGVGLMTAVAMIAAVPNPRLFKNGRHFSAWLGLVPRQFSSGGKTVLGRISKRGDSHLRTLLIHGSRSIVRWADGKNDSLSRWIQKKKETRGINKTVVAMANKKARIIWALMARGEEYRAAV